MKTGYLLFNSQVSIGKKFCFFAQKRNALLILYANQTIPLQHSINMKYLLFIFTLVLISCQSNKNYPAAENAFDAGREFIDAYLKGDFKKANFYMLQDAENNAILRKVEITYKNKPAEIRNQYQTASININSIEDVAPTETIINYANSYDNVAHKVKVILKDGKWQVDLKYTLDGNL